MKKIYKLLFLFLCLLSYNLQSQTNIANYSFSTSTGNTYTDLGANGTVLFTGAYDNEISAAITMGGTFPYGGASFTTCYVSANGFITFGAAPTGTNYTPLSTLNSTTGAISAYGQDAGGSVAHGSEIRYFHTGSEFVVQYKGHSNYFNSAGEILNFQIRLTYATGAINIIYGACTLTNTSTSGTPCQVGIRGNSTTWASNVNNLKLMNIPTGTTCTWADAVAGNANSSTVWNAWSTNANISIPNGLQYSWLPQAAPAPVRTYSAVTLITDNGATLAWTAPAGATQYNVQYRIPGTCGWTNWSGNPVASANVALTGLTPNTTYQVRVQASDGVNNSIYSHIPNAAGSGDGYTTTGTFTTAPLACTGTPEAGTISGTLIRPTCGGSTPSPSTATATGYTTGVSSLAFQWETSLNNMTWSNAIGASATTATYTIPAHTAGQTEYYRLKFTCTPSGLFDVSDVVVQITDPAAPLTQASNVATSSLASTTATITWTAGSGGRRYVVINTVNSFTDPVGTADVTGVSTVYAGGEQKIYDGTGTSVSVTGLTQGTTYFVRVYEYLRCTGTPNTNYYNITAATNNPGSFVTLIPPANDECATAINLSVTNGLPTNIVLGEIAGATASTGIPTGSCNTFSNTLDIWYKFVVPASGNAAIEMFAVGGTANGDNDFSLQVFSGTCGSLVYVNCDEDGSSYPAPSDYLPSLVLTGQTAGNTLYVRVRRSSSTTQSKFSIGVSDYSVLIPIATGECTPATINISPASGNAYRFVPLLDASGGIVAELYPYGKDLGNVTASVHHNIGAVRTDGNGIKYMDVDHRVAVTNQPGSAVDIAFYVSAADLANLMAVDPTVTGIASLKTTKTSNACGSNPSAGGTLLSNYATFTRTDGVSGVAFSPTSFSNFYLHGGLIPLPVNILSFDAKALNNKTVKLTWNVAEEVDVKEYTVERSNDNRIWSAIGTVSASNKSTYDFNDNSPLSGTNYYRLAVKDVNASVAFSDIRTVNFSGKRDMALYPNPANEVLFVSGSDDKNVVVSIYNEVGQIVNTLSSNGEAIRTGGIDVSKLIPGAYSIQVKGESGLTTMRFVKQ